MQASELFWPEVSRSSSSNPVFKQKEDGGAISNNQVGIDSKSWKGALENLPEELFSLVLFEIHVLG